MKNYFLFFVFIIFATSCDYILKPRDEDTFEAKQPEMAIEVEKDKNGCVTDAGFRWSEINKNCIKIIEEGYRLNPIDNLSNLESGKSAFVIFDKSELKAEVFLPNSNSAILLNRNSKNEDFKNKGYRFSLQKGYLFSLNDSILFQAAQTANKAIISSDAEVVE